MTHLGLPLTGAARYCLPASGPPRSVGEVGQHILKRDGVARIQHLLQLKDVSIGISGVGRSEQPDCLRLRVERDARLLEALIIREYVDHVEGDMRDAGVAGRAIGDLSFADW